ncbi:hypothetical protein D3C76_1421210 [compost metagenome]
MRARRLNGREHAAIEHGAGTDAQLRALLAQYLDGFQTVLRTQGHFQGTDATGGQRIGQGQDVFLTGNGDHRQDARLVADDVDPRGFLGHRELGLWAFEGGHDSGSLAHGHQ